MKLIYIYIGLAIAFLGNASRILSFGNMCLEHMGYTTSFYNNFMALCEYKLFTQFLYCQNLGKFQGL